MCIHVAVVGVELHVIIFFNQHLQADKSEDLDAVEVFKAEHYVAAARREYVENNERRNQPAVTQTQLKKALVARGNTSSF